MFEYRLGEQKQERYKKNGGLCLYLALSLIAFLLLGILQINSSSLGILNNSSLQSKDILVGYPRSIRSDEFLRASPSLIGSLSPRSELSNATPLSFEGSQQYIRSKGSLINQIRDLVSISPFKPIYRLLPTGMAFSFDWWFNTLVLFLSLPILFTLLQLRWSYGVATSLLFWLSPITQWWSLWPLRIISTALFAITVSLAYLRWNESRRKRGKGSHLATLGVGLFLGAVLSRLVFFYQPWSIPASLILGVFGLSIFVSEPSRRNLKLELSVYSALSFVAIVLANLTADSELLGVTASTVYPGQRRSTGGLSFPYWSGSFDWVLQRSEFSGVNQSEIALGPLIFLLFAISVPVVLHLRSSSNRITRSIVLGVLCSSIFVLWAYVPLPSRFFPLNGLEFIPPARGLQITSLTAVLFFGISIALWDKEKVKKRMFNRSRAVFLFVISLGFVLVVRDGLDLRNIFFPSMSLSAVWITALATVGATGLPFFLRHRSVALIAPLLIFSFLSTGFTNPLMRGVGVFHDSELMNKIQMASSSSDGRWASDQLNIDALIIAAALPQLSGQSGSGPNYSAWRLIDADESAKDVWNRGSAFISFSWNADPKGEISLLSADLIRIAIDPCSSSLDKLNLKWIVASQALPNDCLILYDLVQFVGAPVRIYKVG